MRAIAFLFVLAVAGAAHAQTPAPAPAAAPPPAAEPPAAAQPPAVEALRPPPPPTQAPAKITREQIIAALAADKTLEDDFVAQLRERHAIELNEMTQKRHDDDSKQIALNKKHVIMAYAALWVLSVGFLIYMWNRQQALSARIAQLQKDLEAATREDKK